MGKLFANNYPSLGQYFRYNRLVINCSPFCRIATKDSIVEMSNSLTVKEQTHTFWKTLTIICGILCVALFVVFWRSTDPFWTGIFRLGAFIFFAGTVLGYLKFMDGPLLVTLTAAEELLLVTYRKNEKTIQEEEFKRKTIKSIRTDKPGTTDLTTYLQPRTATFKISFTDTDRELFLFEFSGRPLLFGQKAQNQIKDFLGEFDIHS